MGDTIITYDLSSDALRKKFEDLLDGTSLKKQSSNQSTYFGYIRKHDLFMLGEEVKKSKNSFKKDDYITVYSASNDAIRKDLYVEDGKVII
jgi:CRISPR-associated endonuclease Cas2